MRWIVSLSLLLTAACASREPLEEPTIKSVPAALIPESGASLYIIEAPDDWLDDCSSTFLWLTKDAPENSAWMGDQAFSLILRLALSRREVSYKAQGDFLITSGHPTEATLTDPESIDAPLIVGFHAKLNASLGRRPGYINMEWLAQILTTDKKGTETAVTISEGKDEVGLPAALAMWRRKTKDRSYFLLLRIASLEE